MSRFIQFHALTSYPPSNPNRDDLGRPKTAQLGGYNRLRISSQALKRAIRLHPAFRSRLDGALGERTQRLGEVVRDHLMATKELTEDAATKIAEEIAAAFGKLDADKPTRIRQLAFVSPEEKAAALRLAEQRADGEKLPKDKELAKLALRSADGAADIAMFGRMLADNPDYNRDAAVQVAHAITTHNVEVEDDYYTAVDDLKRPAEDMGAGFVGEAGFGAGVFYTYACIDRGLLIENLDGDRALAAKAIEAFAEAFALASPSGKKNSFANHVRAAYLLATRGDQQPLTLADAFLEPVRSPRSGGDVMQLSIGKLQKQRERYQSVYGPSCDASQYLNIFAEGGVDLVELAGFAAAEIDAVRIPETV